MVAVSKLILADTIVFNPNQPDFVDMEPLQDATRQLETAIRVVVKAESELTQAAQHATEARTKLREARERFDAIVADLPGGGVES